ncbi:non-ribosomal peptide synthetase [Desulfopila sp. IMCC35008]|uniref:non-ribosomal peptide synthetase n=1 Tax=Desulfopila sp. IMCC35008 TaxID=2653858 RepID=UPI0013D02FE3|nr:non-ribosomal peptide synthetase [Desulfopila sp. IMCC35008]
MNKSYLKDSSLEQEKKLLEALLRQKAALDKRTFPMSMGQTSLFVDYLARPESSYYNLSFSFRIESEIDISTLEKACQLLIDRHEILRTTYGFENDSPVQTVHGHRDALLHRVNLNVSDEATIRKRLISDSRHPFDLINGPVIRTNIYSAGTDTQYFLLVLHHIAGDGRSLLNLIKELLDTYKRLSHGEGTASFIMPRSQYSDFVRWEQNLLDSPQGKVLESFWKLELDGWLPDLVLPRSFGTVHGILPCPDTRSIAINNDLMQEVSALSKQTGISFNTIVFSAFAILLHRYSEQDELIIGMPVSTLISLSGKTIDPLVSGYLVNPLVIRSKMACRYNDYLSSLETRISNALDNQAYPFYKIQQAQARKKGVKPSMLIQTMFNYLNFQKEVDLAPLIAPVEGEGELRIDGLKLSPFPFPFQESDRELNMTLIRTADSFYLSVDYDQRLFSQEAIDQKIDDYLLLLGAITRTPDSDISTLLEQCAIFGSPALVEKSARPPAPITKAERFWAQTVHSKFEPLSIYGKTPLSLPSVVKRRSLVIGQERTIALLSQAGRGATDVKDLDLSVFNILAGIIVVLVNKITGLRGLPLDVFFHPDQQHRSGDRNKSVLNGLPLVIGLSDAETFHSLVRKIEGNIDLMMKFSEAAPFDSDRNSQCASGVPVFDTARIAIRFSPFPTSDHLEEHVHAVQCGTSSEGTCLGFNLYWDRDKQEIPMEIVFDETLFDSGRQQSLIDLFSAILDAFLSDVNQPIETISRISKREMAGLVKLRRSAETNRADSTLIPELFSRQAQLTPEAIAVIAGDQTLTYRELDTYSNNVAARLIRQGAGPDTLTGLCMTRSIETMVALLAIFKSGSIYVPIDPELPQKRISYMIDDSCISIMVTQERFISTGLFKDLEVVCICPETLTQQSFPETDHTLVRNPDSPAYVIYTSGSTGNPKGILVSKRSIARHCRNAAQVYAMSRYDRILQFASLSFDASLEQIFAGLISGAALVLRDDSIWTPLECLDNVERYGITVLNFPPAYMKEFFKAYNAEISRTLETLRLFITGGDVLHSRVLDLWRVRFARQARLINAYGPTETTITAMHYEIPEEAESAVLHSVPIGRPLAGRQAYVVDDDRHLVPAGVPGELILGGDGIAIGYLGRPELTREKFFISTFPGQRNGRCYATGDRVRWREDGNLEYLGRFDDQVKIRGFRIELGEIESCLMAHPDVLEASVVVFEGPERNIALKAYFVCEDRRPDLVIYLRDRLPAYMIPGELIELDRLPRLPSGKIDRKTLESYEHSAARSPLSLPKDEVDAVVAAIWSHVLGQADISMNADFFESGGHSLLAVQILSKIHTTFQLGLTLADLFQTPRLIDFTSKIKARLSGQQLAIEPLGKSDYSGNVPLSFGQTRLWFLDNFEGASTVYSMPCALRITGSLDAAIVKKVFDEICRRHEALRTTFKNEIGIPVQIIHERMEPEVTVFVCDGRAETRQILSTEAKRPFDLEKGSLLRVAILKMEQEPGHQILFFNIHHIISDGWSIHVLLNEFTKLYTAFLNDAPSPLPELPIQYADYGAWQKNVLEKSLYKPQIAYWKQKLNGLPPLLELPADKPRPSVQTSNGAIESFTFNETLARQIRDFSTRKGATLFMTLAAVFSLLLSRYTGREDIVTGFPVSGRHHDRTEKLIGFFVNTLALRVTIPGKESFDELLETTKQTVLDALNNQDIPFEKLIDELGVERNIQYSPLLQVIFSMITMDFEDLFKVFDPVEILEIENHTTKNDFTFFVLNKGHSLTGSIEYNTDLFAAATVRQIVADFKHLLQAVLATPGWTCDRLLDSCDIFGSPAGSQRKEGADALLAQSNLTKNQLLTYLGQTTKQDSRHYNNPHLYEIRGHIETHHLINAFDAIVTTSDALQSRFFETTEGIPQRTLRKESRPCEYLDLSGIDDSQFREWVRLRSCRVFDLGASVFDAVLIKRNADFHVWFLNIHHIVIDGWSWNHIIIPRVSTLYRAACEGKRPCCNSKHTFESFCSWEKNYISSPQYAADKRFWDYAFKIPYEPLTFYGDYPRKVSTRVDRILFRLGEHRTLKLREIAERDPFFTKNLNVTLLHIATTLVLVFLNKISGNRNLSIGIPFHNRKAGANDEIIGLLMQTLPLRLSISDNDTFSSLCNTISYTINLMRQHSNYTLSNPHEAPNYDVLINVIKYAHPVLGDAAVSGGWTGPGHGHESLGFIITNDLSEPDLEMGVDFHADVFDRPRQNQVIEHFLSILDCFLADQKCKIRNAQVLSTHEAHSIIHDLNRSEKSFDTGLTIIDLIERAACNYPERVAVVADDQSITYAELDRQAEIIADYLAGKGLGPEDGVGLLMERSIELFIGITGILKAGCCYVPIDPEYPEKRKRFIAADAKLKVILTHSDPIGCYLIDGLGTVEIRQILSADSSISCPRKQAGPENSIYITYTSGSTGKPKGVVVTNGNLVNQYLAWEDAYDLLSTSAHLQMANFTFDVFSGDMVRGLCSGGTLVICRKETMADPEKLYHLMTSEQIDFAEFVPVVLRLLANSLKKTGRKLDFMKVLCCGSDTWYFSEYMEIKALCGETTRLINSYGVTEATIDSSFFEVGNFHPDGNSLVPIGRPFANNRLYVLDSHSLSPLPLGMTGELFIGGAGVSRGYLNQPDLTAKGFVADPFTDNQGATLFRTGDLARHLPDGTIALLGRIDNQLKIRGFRVEAGEIESALSNHPEVKESLVMLREDRPGQKQLVAYLILQSSGNEDDLYAGFRDYLKDRVPDYMIPNHFIPIKTFPLLLNGKIDRKSLPKPVSFDTTHRYTPPSTPEETLLALIWEQVLGIEKPGIHDNFFQLGGDSIISIQIAARAKQQGLSFSVKQLFEFQTIHELARVADKVTMVQPDQEAVTGSVPLTPIQQAFFSHAGHDLHHYNQSALVRIPETVIPEMMETALNHLLQHHDALHLTFRKKEGDTWLQEFKTDRSDVVLEHHLMRDMASVTERLHGTIDIDQGHLVKAALFKDDDQKPCRLLIIIHHLAVDGVSWRILLSDLSTAYRQLETGKELELPQKTASFKQWAESWAEHTRHTPVDLDYWAALHEQARFITPLDPDKQRNQAPNTIGGTTQLRVELGEQTTRALLQDIHHAYNTRIQEVLVAAVVLAMGRITGNYKLFMDMEGHGRETIDDYMDLSRTVGWFTSIYPVVLSPADTSIGTIIQYVKEQLRSIPSNGITFGYLTIDSGYGNKTDPAHSTPKPEILFNYLGQFNHHRESDGIFQSAWEDTGPNQSPLQSRGHQLEINGHVIDGKLSFSIAYNCYRYRDKTMESLAQELVQGLESIIEHCFDPANKGFTPSDFSLLNGISQKDLDCTLRKIPLLPGSTDIKDQIEDIYPLAPIQEGMLFYEQFDTEANLYLVQMSGIMEGEVDPDRMKQAYQSVLARHSILRSGFIQGPSGQFLHVVNKRVEVPFVINDLTALPPEKQKVETQKQVKDDTAIGFDFSRAPVMRCTLNKLDEDKYHFILSNHHVLMDGWSTPLFFKELFLFYESADCEQTPELPSPGTYRQYISWLQQQDKQKATDYWKTYLEGFSMPTPLPGDRNRTPAKSFQVIQNHADYKLIFPPDLSRDLVLFSQQKSLTLNTILQGAYAILLSRCSNMADIVYGATATVRPSDVVEIESMVGLFINTLPVRVKVLPDQDLMVFLKDLMKNQARREPYSFASLADIQRSSNIPPGAPLFESIFVFENYPVENFGHYVNRKLRFSDVHGNDKTNFALTVTGSPGTTITLNFTYDSDRFETETIRQMVEQYRSIVLSIPANSGKKVSDIKWLSANGANSLLTVAKKSNHHQPRYAVKPTKYLAPRTSTEIRIKKIWEQVLEVKTAGVRDNFFESGGQSLLAVRLMTSIEYEFNKKIPLVSLFDHPTIEGLASLVDAGKAPEWTPIVSFRKTGNRPPLFCVHPLGGTVFQYQDLADHINSNYPFYGIQAKGTETDSTPFADIGEMAQVYKQHIRGLYPDSSCILMGWSFGGSVAFEIARRMEKDQKRSVLILLDSNAPGMNGVSHHALSSGSINQFEQIRSIVAPGINLDPDRLNNMKSFEMKLAYLTETARAEGKVPAGFNTEQCNRFIKVCNAHARALCYEPEPFNGRIILLKAEANDSEDPCLGWERLAVDGVEVIQIPGDHYTMLSTPNVEILGKTLSKIIEEEI